METSANISIDDYVCNICNKIYKNKSGIWKHNKKYHNNEAYDLTPINSNLTPINSNLTPINSNLTPINSNLTPINSNLTPINSSINNLITNNLSCNYCNKIFNRIDNLTRHTKFRCKKKINTDILLNENNKLKLIIEKQSEEIKTVKLMISSLINKNCKVHPKTLQKINKQLNGDHNIINENNGTINNNIFNIIALGHENLSEVFSKKEKMAILKNKFYCLPELVEYTHFNDKYPQFKNILITNTQNTLAYKFDTKKKQFIAVNKDELLDDIVDERMCDINSFYEELENNLDDKTKEIIEKVKDKIENDPAYKELKKKDIKLIIYNNRKKVIKDASIIDEIDI